MKHNMLVASIAGFTLLGLASIAPAEPASQPGSADWPQWRGPNRDGVAPASPTLLDSWPKEGPPLLWKSQPIPCGLFGQEGGAGSPAVAGGKVFLFVDWRRTQPGPFAITTQRLKELGWEEGVPDDLAKKIEGARVSDKRNGPKLLAGAELDAYVKDFISTLDPKQAEQFGPHIKKRLEQGKDACNWSDFKELSRIRDKEFKKIEELIAAGGGAFNNFHGDGRAIRLARGPLEAKAYTHTDTVLCLDATTGKEIWKKEFPGAGFGFATPNWMCGASCTPTVSAEKCFVTGTTALYCLSVKDGAVIWQTSLKTFSNSAPLLANGAVYVGLLEGLAAFNAETGQVLWTQPAAANNCCSAVPWTSDGKSYVICGGAMKVLCLEPDKGAVLWQAHIGQNVYATPVISGDTMVALGDYSYLTAFRMTPKKAGPLWSDGKLGDRGASPLIYQDHAYHPPAEYGRPAACLDLKTGVRKWTQAIPGGVCSPLVADGKVIATVNDCTVMFKATPEKFEELGRFPIPKDMKTFASPAIAAGRLYLRQGDGIVCYDLTAPEK